MEESQIKQCCLCGDIIDGWGNNASPLGLYETDRCCDQCNHEKVIPARINQIFQNHKNQD